jgi:hypothetical protein
MLNANVPLVPHYQAVGIISKPENLTTGTKELLYFTCTVMLQLPNLGPGVFPWNPVASRLPRCPMPNTLAPETQERRIPIVWLSYWLP